MSASLAINPLAFAFLIKLIVIVAIGSCGIASVGRRATHDGLVVLASMGPPGRFAVLVTAVAR